MCQLWELQKIFLCEWQWNLNPVWDLGCTQSQEQTFIPETKEQSKHTGYTESPIDPKNFKEMLTMTIVFWSKKWVLLIVIMQRGITITKEVYCETLCVSTEPLKMNKEESDRELFHNNPWPHNTNITPDLKKVYLRSFQPSCIVLIKRPSDFYQF